MSVLGEAPFSGNSQMADKDVGVGLSFRAPTKAEPLWLANGLSEQFPRVVPTQRLSPLENVVAKVNPNPKSTPVGKMTSIESPWLAAVLSTPPVTEANATLLVPEPLNARNSMPVVGSMYSSSEQPQAMALMVVRFPAVKVISDDRMSPSVTVAFVEKLGWEA